MEIKALVYLSGLVTMLCALTALLTVSRRSSKIYKLLTAFVLLTAIHFIIMRVMGHFQIRNHFQQNNFMYLRFPLLALIYYLSFRQLQSRGVWLCILLWCLTPVFWWFNFQAVGWNTVHTSYTVAASSLIIACILLYLYKMFSSSEGVIRFATYPLFWTSIGLFFFFLTVIPSFGLINLLMASNLLVATQSFIPVNIVTCFSYSLIAADFIIQRKQQKAADLSASS